MRMKGQRDGARRTFGRALCLMRTLADLRWICMGFVRVGHRSSSSLMLMPSEGPMFSRSRKFATEMPVARGVHCAIRVPCAEVVQRGASDNVGRHCFLAD